MYPHFLRLTLLQLCRPHICDVVKETDISLVHQPTEHFYEMQQMRVFSFQFLGDNEISREEGLYEAMNDKLKAENVSDIMTSWNLGLFTCSLLLPLSRLHHIKQVAGFPLSCLCLSTSANAGRVLSQQPSLSPSPWQLGQLPGSHGTEMCAFSCNRYVWNCVCVCESVYLGERERERDRKGEGERETVSDSYSGKHVWKTNSWYDCATPGTYTLTYSYGVFIYVPFFSWHWNSGEVP